MIKSGCSFYLVILKSKIKFWIKMLNHAECIRFTVGKRVFHILFYDIKVMVII